MTQAHIIVSGFVQGVGYRQFVKSHAKNLRINGWVKNLSDGRVEALFQGSKEDIEKIIKICEKGSFLAEVKGIVVEWEQVSEEFSEFDILHT